MQEVDLIFSATYICSRVHSIVCSIISSFCLADIRPGIRSNDEHITYNFLPCRAEQRISIISKIKKKHYLMLKSISKTDNLSAIRKLTHQRRAAKHVSKSPAKMVSR